MRPPHDPEAEAAAIGCLLRATGPERDRLLGLVGPESFYVPEHARVVGGIVGQHHAGGTMDPLLVARAMPAYPDGSRPANDPDAVRRLATAGDYGTAGVGYAERVASLAAARRAQAVGHELAIAATEGDLDAVDRLLASAPERVARPATEPAEAPDLADLLERPDPVDRPWVVRGLLREGDRLVLTGGEGHGKMTFLRQLAMGVACGRHPLTGTAHPRRRALILDLQEDEHDLRRELGRMARGYQRGWLFAMARPQGMNLLSAADARWAEALIAHHRPALVVTGPLYKSYRADDDRSAWSESTVEAVTRTWDELRAQYGFALAVEGHAGHDRDTWRVRGSSAWYAWPDFGLGLEPQVNDVRREVLVKHWRGDRHPGRPWPRRLFGGTDSTMPWEPDPATARALAAIRDDDGTVPLDDVF